MMNSPRTCPECPIKDVVKYVKTHAFVPFPACMQLNEDLFYMLNLEKQAGKITFDIVERQYGPDGDFYRILVKCRTENCPGFVDFSSCPV